MDNILERRLLLPYSATQVFDLVADIERYPEFVPGWREARIAQRDGDSLIVEQRIAVGPGEWRFVSRACLDRPHGIDIDARDAPFGGFNIHWRIESLGDAGCAVDFRARHDPRSRILRRLAAGVLEDQLLRIVDAFEDRARALYGSST